MSERVPLTLADLPELLQYIHADNRDTWLLVGMGIKAEFGNNGFDAWDTWSAGADSYSTADATTVWRSFRKAGTGMGTVIKLAKDNGWRPRREPITAEEKRRLNAEAEARRAVRQAEIEADEARAQVMREAVAAACELIWTKHCKPQGESPYLERKQVGAFGVGYFHYTVVLAIDDERQRCDVWVGSETREFFAAMPKPRPDSLSFLMFKAGSIAIPLRDAAGKLWSLQAINEQGTKLFPKYGRKAGCRHVLGELDGATVIGEAEGYATAASVHMAKGCPVAMALDSGNMPAVARDLAGQCPDALLVVAGDDDPTKPGNPGRKKAEAAAGEVGGIAAFPTQPAEGEAGQDWNDVHVAWGLNAVAQQLDAAVAAGKPSPTPSADEAAAPLEYEVPISEVLPGAPTSACGEAVPDMAGALTPGGAGGFRIGEQELLKDFVLIYGTDLVWDCNRRRMVKLAALREVVGRERIKLWQESQHRRVAEDVVFDPTERCGPTMLNLFDGFKMAPSPAGQAGCKKILAHLGKLCGERRDEYVWLLRWIAYPLQNPGAKMATSVVMFGAEGPGKSLVWEKVVKRIYGEYGVTIGQAQLESQFTGWQSRKLFALAEEVVSRAEMRHYKGLLKHLVTGETLQINEKMQSLREEHNHLNFVFLSNSTVPLELDDGDRRYLVLYVDNVPPKEYFAELVAEIENGGIAAFYQYMLTLPMEDFNEHTKPPLNEEKQSLIEGSMSPARYFLRVWQRGDLDLPYGAAVAGDLYRAFCRWCERANEFKRREREFYQEVQRDMDQVRKDIKFPSAQSDFKTCRIYVPKGEGGKHRDKEWIQQVALQCRAFRGALDERYQQVAA
jgi:putative DNA primase/helicase